MKIINIASNNSVWRGLDYYKEKKIKKYKKISDYEYEAIALGSDKNNYNVFLDIEHPRKSKCDCPHAKDKRIICKHIVALYFTIFPKEVGIFLKEVEEAQNEYEDYKEKLYKKTLKHINKMSKKELEESLVYILNISPDWIYDKFVRDYVGFDVE